jgi:two-component sensor histidine kinase
MAELNHISKLLHILVISYLLAMAASVIIILLFLPYFPKYKIIINETSKTSTTGMVLYDDIDGNGYSDEIFTGNNFTGSVFVTMILEPGMAHEQWNFSGNYNFTEKFYLITGDYDNNGTKEMYVFTLSADSVYLNCIDYSAKNHVYFKNKFISRTGLKEGSTHIYLVPAQMEDLNEDGKKELIFGLNSGFGIYPRQVFAYDIVNDVLLKSPKSGYYISSIIQKDITGDGHNEIIPNGYATDNINDTTYPYPDQSCWLMVLDQQLRFMFTPVEFPGIYGRIYPFVLHNNNQKPLLGAMINPPASVKPNARLCMFDLHGKIINEKIVPTESNTDIGSLITFKHRNIEFIGIQIRNGNLLIYDSSLRFIEERKFGFNLKYYQFDLDRNSSLEYVFVDYQKDQIVITQSDFSHPVKFNLAFSGNTGSNFSLKLNGENPPELAVDSGDMLSLIEYSSNPLYYTRWLIYAGIYLSVLMFTLLVRRIQRVQLQRKYDTEKKITELQLKIVRNQLDPHFAFNAINSAIDAINNNKGDEAGQHLQQFSQMYRSLVLSSDKIKRTLKEELEFTENYLKMEQFRFNKKFEYSITIDPAIDTTMEVPKMIVQSYTENAIKHGLLCKKDGGGILEILAEQIDSKLILTIKDNGRGRKEAALAGSSSTGKGLEMMNNLYDLYYKITNRKITAEISDLYDGEGKSAGTRVRVTIPVK